MPRSKGVGLLLLATVLTLSGKAWGNDTPENESQSPQLASVRTYDLRDFQQPLPARLSGGLAQQIPYRMATDSQGRLLVTDPGLSLVHVLDVRQGKRWQIRGDAQHRPIAPAYIAVDADDNIYVSDLGLSTVLVFDSTGRFKQTIGSVQLSMPTGIWVDKAARTLYVADWWRNEISLFDLQGNLLRVFGSWGKGPGQLSNPEDIVIHGDTLVVLDTGNSRFETFDLQGNFRGVWPFGANRMPIAFAFDGEGNLVYVDSYSGGLVAVDPRGIVLAKFGQLRDFGQSRPRGVSFKCVAADAGGHILALRPTLDIEAVELTAGASGSERPSTTR